jgi:hypothetical protein
MDAAEFAVGCTDFGAWSIISGVGVGCDAGAGVGSDCGLTATSAAGVALVFAVLTEAVALGWTTMGSVLATDSAEGLVSGAKLRRATLGPNSSSETSATFAAVTSDASNVGTSRRPDRRLLERGESTECPLRGILFETTLAGVERRLDGRETSAGGWGTEGLASVGVLT